MTRVGDRGLVLVEDPLERRVGLGGGGVEGVRRSEVNVYVEGVFRNS